MQPPQGGSMFVDRIGALMSNGTRVLVTGAAGFIGSHLVERLVRDGCRVRAFVHYNAAGYLHNLERLNHDVLREVEIVAGDIADPFSVNAAVADRDTVFHLASLIAIPYSYIAPAAYIATNVQGTLNVLQACREHATPRLVHTSTSETYGTAQYVPIDEKHPLVGQSPYSASKIAADKIAESFHCSYDLQVATVRPFNTYGPRQSARAVIPTIVSQALLSDEIRLGSLEPVRDFTFVEDTVAGFVAASKCDEAVGQVVNLGSGASISIGEVVEKTLALTSRDIPVTSEQRRVRPPGSEVMKLHCDNSKARRLLDWAPSVSFDEGLARVVDYVRDHAEQYNAEMYNV